MGRGGAAAHHRGGGRRVHRLDGDARPRSAAMRIATNAALAAQVRELLGAAKRTMMLDLSKLDFAKGNGLVTVVTQDARTGDLLMVAHADREALERRWRRARCTTARARAGLWHKGATSGNVQRVVSLDGGLRRRRGARARGEGGPRVPHRRGDVLRRSARLDALVARWTATIAERARAGSGARREAELHAAAPGRPQPAPQEDRRGGARSW